MKKSCIFIFSLLALFCTVGYAQPYTWNNVAIGAGGFVTGIITSKTEANLMYARTDVGGAYRWNAATSKWIPLLDWCSIDETGYQGVEALALDPQVSSNLYMLVGTSYFNGGKTAILRSTDYGNTFSITDVSAQFRAHGNGMGRQNGERLVVDPNNNNILFCGTRANGLWKSTNAGASFSLVGSLGVTTTTNGNGIDFVVFDPAGTIGSATQTFFVGVSRVSGDGPNLYKTTNGGTSFTAVAGAPSLMPQRAVMASDKNLYITYADKEGPWNIGSGQLWKYNTTTNVWTNITPAGFTTGFGGISVDPGNSNRIITSTINAYWGQYVDGANTVWGDRMLLSTNGGTSWTDLVGSGITMDANSCTWIFGHSIHWAGSIEFNPYNTSQAWVVSGNGVFSCDNVNVSPTTWKFNAIGLEETVPLDIVSITGGPLVSVIGDYDGFKHSSITNYSPIHTPRIGTTTGLAFAANNTNKLVRVGGDGSVGGKMYYTLNQGTTWTQCTAINGFKGKVALSSDGNTFIHCPEGSSTLYRSTNNGTNWNTCNGVSIADAVPVADMVNANKIYAYNNSSGVMMVSTDAGANFTAAASPGTWGAKLIRTVPGREGHIWIAMYGGGLKRSINSGTSFTTIAGVTSCDAVGLGKPAPAATYHTLYIWGTVGGVTGVFRSINEGASWVRVNDDLHEYGGSGNGQFVIGDMNVYGRVYMSTVGRGIVYADTDIPAPVELNSFSARWKEEDVLLEWETISEKNNSHFEVEKSSDGKSFLSLGIVQGNSNSIERQQYNYLDKHPFSDRNYYRLKQIDINGQFVYSEIININIDADLFFQLTPNPARQYVEISGNFSSAKEILVYDALGRQLLTNLEELEGKMRIDISDFLSGIYHIHIIENDNRWVGKIMKIE